MVKCKSAWQTVATSMLWRALELNDMHRSRNRADYDLNRVDVERRANAIAIVKQASDMIRVLDLSFTGSQRLQLQAAIREWRHNNGYP